MAVFIYRPSHRKATQRELERESTQPASMFLTHCLTNLSLQAVINL